MNPRRIAPAWPAILALALLLPAILLLASACSLRPLLTDVQVAPARISPDADGKDDVTLITYRLTRSANLSIYFENAAGQRFYFRQERRRSRGPYNVYWGGVIAGETLYQTEFTKETVKSRVLPDGAYTWFIEATDDNGHTQTANGTLEIAGADTTIPELQNFSVAPQVFTPNQDGLSDRVTVTYYLTKPANVTVYLLQPDGSTYPLAEKEREIKPGEVGLHIYDYDGGVDKGADPPADGDYTVVAEAQDKAGNLVIVNSALTIQEGGVPRADIIQAAVEFSPKIIPLGGTLYFTATVENFGSVPIRTTGPTPGTAYRGDENFNTLKWYEEPGAWRFGIDFETNSTGRPYPYRYAIGRFEVTAGQYAAYRVYPGHDGWPPCSRTRPRRMAQAAAKNATPIAMYSASMVRASLWFS